MSRSVFRLVFFKCLLCACNVFFIFLARASPRPPTLESSVVDELNTFKGVPYFSSFRMAVFSPTPGKLHSMESCCFCTSFEFLIFLINGPLLASFLDHIDINNLAVREAVGV